ncbi:MAG TPA: hypothetical protein H9902_09100 [Candidatus Stackebrandtia faecavium]|nr:hypothetical protein [Candidatus Stackebrandtia faecavium]
MYKTWLTRLAVAAAMAMALVGLTAAPAAAATNKTLVDSHGQFTFIDDGDVFQICDNKADGHGVTGQLQLRSGVDGSLKTVMTINDGGDDGCDKQGFNIGNWHTYRMVYWWNGNKSGTVQVTEFFNE